MGSGFTALQNNKIRKIVDNFYIHKTRGRKQGDGSLFDNPLLPLAR